MKLLLLLPLLRVTEATFFVSPDGSDSNDGTQASPFLTLTRAKEAANLENEPSTCQISLASGRHELPTPFVLTAADVPCSFVSDDADSPAVISGGVLLDNKHFTEHDNTLLSYDLSNSFPDPSPFGEIRTGTLGDCANSQSQLFSSTTPTNLARYPNVDQQTQLWDFVSISSACDSDPSESPCLSEFTVTGDDAARLAALTPPFFIHGYWSFDWADNHVRVVSITANDANSTTLKIDPETNPLYGFLPNARFVVENILNELDDASEFLIDRDLKVLYAHASLDLSADLVVSKSESVLSFQDAKGFTFTNLVFSDSQATLVSGTGSGIAFESCAFRNAGGDGVKITGTDIIINNSSLTTAGCSGISLTGGDRVELTSSGNVVSGSVLKDYGRWKRTYMPGVGFGGDGIRIENNEISQAPHQGIYGSGNDHLIQNNYLHDLCVESSDSGAFYTGRSWSNRGNVFAGNRIENVRPLTPTKLGYLVVMGVYLDDQMSGWAIENNTFVNVMQGALLGGGRDNVFRGNSFENCDVGIEFDCRGLTWDLDNCVVGGPFEKDLESFDYLEDVWSEKYPAAVTTFDVEGGSKPCTPQWNVIANNSFCSCQEGVSAYDGAEADNTLENNVERDTC
jgi:hypothetical protein